MRLFARLRRLYITSFISCIYKFTVGSDGSILESPTRFRNLDKLLKVARLQLMLGL
jgi:hypothetical protein